MTPRRGTPDDAVQDITTIVVPQIADMIEPDLLQEFQDAFAGAVGVPIVVRDDAGKRLTQPSRPGHFASLPVKASEEEAAERASAELALKAVGSGKIEQARMETGFVRFAAPVVIQGRPAGALVVGDVPDEKTDARQIEKLARRMKAPPGEIRKRSSQELSTAISLLQFAANALGDLCHEGWIIRRHVEELRTVHRVSQLLNSTRHLNDVLELIVRTVCETLEVKSCGLRLLDDDTGELVVKAVHGLSPEYLSKGPVPIKRSEIDRAAMEGDPVYIRDISRDPRILYPAEMMREGIRSILVIGLKVRGRAIGALRIYTGEKRRFHQSEIALAEAIANLSATAIENAKLYEETLQKQQLERELSLAAQIQSHLLPAGCPSPAGFDICAVNEPARQVGGDFYDFVKTPGDDRLGIVIADVCGKSMAGALLMATARSAMRVQCEHCMTPAEIVSRVNISLCRDTRPEEFVTFFFAKLDTKKRILHYTNAGHNRPVLYRGDETVLLEESGMVCGVRPENTYHESDIGLESGDILLLHTDGLDEARNEKDELFGLERAGEVIRTNRDHPADRIAQMLRREVHRFIGTREQTDDLTLILIKVN